MHKNNWKWRICTLEEIWTQISAAHLAWFLIWKKFLFFFGPCFLYVKIKLLIQYHEVSMGVLWCINTYINKMFGMVWIYGKCSQIIALMYNAAEAEKVEWGAFSLSTFLSEYPRSSCLHLPKPPHTVWFLEISALLCGPLRDFQALLSQRFSVLCLHISS